MITSSAELNRTSLPTVPAPQQGAGIDYELFLDCVHCGLCTSACPTYVELGDENDSPRGRIYLMRALTDGRIELNDEVRRHLDLCLDCRACESACPSGVQYGHLIEPFRIHLSKTGQAGDSLSRLERFLLFQFTPYAKRMRWALAPARLLQWTGLDRLFEKLGLLRFMPRALRQMHDMLPRLKRHYGRLPTLLPAEGKRRARVALFTGCAADAFFPETNVATARVLQRNGCDVWIPRGQACCGALHYHAGQELVPLNETEICCGAAGSYNLTQPEMAERLGERKAANILAADPQAVFTGNVGCILQIGRYLRKQRPDIWVGHPVDALWRSY